MKKIIFTLFACIMLTMGVGSFTYAVQTNAEQSALTVDEINIEKAVNTDYAMLFHSTAICEATTEIKPPEIWVSVDEVAIIASERKVILYRLARDNLINLLAYSG